MDYKLKTDPGTFCEGTPPEFRTIFEYIKNLSFYDTPDYRFIQGELAYLLKHSDEEEHINDW